MRLFCLKWYYEAYPNTKYDKVFYCDSDIIFRKKLDFDKFLNDEICYLSDTKTYLNASYFDSKEKDVREDCIQKYKSRDILADCTKLAGITREICEKNNDNTGGAQYILTGIDTKFWDRCINTCLGIRLYLQEVNQLVMRGNSVSERENNGFQSWVADMLAIQWNLWREGIETATPKELDFAWSTDKIENVQDKAILHNAGITGEEKIRITENNKTVKDENNVPVILEAPAFWKGSKQYINNSPFDCIQDIKNILNHPLSRQFCTAEYCKQIIKTKNNLNL